MRSILFSIVFVFLARSHFSQKVEVSVQTGHTAAIKGIKFSPNDNYIASFGEDGKIVLWNVNIGKQYISLNTGDDISDLAFLNDSMIVISTLGGKIKTWEFF